LEVIHGSAGREKKFEESKLGPKPPRRLESVDKEPGEGKKDRVNGLRQQENKKGEACPKPQRRNARSCIARGRKRKIEGRLRRLKRGITIKQPTTRTRKDPLSVTSPLGRK